MQYYTTRGKRSLETGDVTRSSPWSDITDEFVGERAPNWFLALIWNGYLSRYLETLTPG